MMLPCESCRFLIAKRCTVLQQPGRMREWLVVSASGHCPHYVDSMGQSVSGMSVANDLWAQCQTCTHLLVGGRCEKFLAGCDAEQRRQSALRLGCRYKSEYVRPTWGYSGPELDPATFVRVEDLVGDTLELAARIPLHEFAAIVGVARSGLVPASVFAMMAHRPLFSISPQSKRLVPAGHGFRLDGTQRLPNGPVLVCDDSIMTGKTLATVLSAIDIPPRKLFTAVIYASPDGAKQVDFCARRYEGPHFFEWCFANTAYSAQMAWDLDGVISDDHGAVKYAPRRFPAVIVTGRPEDSRYPTEEWLREHKIPTSQLIMRPSHVADDDESIACWKAWELIRLRCERRTYMYVESSCRQAVIIAQVAKMPVICPAAGRVFGFDHWNCFADGS